MVLQMAGAGSCLPQLKICNNSARGRMLGVLSGGPHVTTLSHLLIKTISYYSNIEAAQQQTITLHKVSTTHLFLKGCLTHVFSTTNQINPVFVCSLT